MRKLLNTLYVTNPDVYLAADGENVALKQEGKIVARVPLLNIEEIVVFGYSGVSPALMRKCLTREMPITISLLSPFGKLNGRIIGEQNGNVLLRREQYRIADDESEAVKIARNAILGKVYNERWVLERCLRDHAMKIDADTVKAKSKLLADSLDEIANTEEIQTLLGVEGVMATAYFSVFDQMILTDKNTFYFHGRNRRPPLDRVNALLSFAYTLLTNDCASALETVGLDSYVGFLHQDRPGRQSLASDLVEELRAPFADRFVLSLINRKQVKADDFLIKEDGAVLLTDKARKNFLNQWQMKKQETITHPFLKEKLEWGLVPYVQAQLLARYIRGDLDGYPCFLWK